MHVESTPLARARSFEVSPRAFRRLAFAAAAMLLVVVGTGATVRLTASGLGCEHWPGCQPGNPFPEKGYHSYIEFGNRVVAFATIVVTLAAATASVFTRALDRRVRVLAFAAFVGTLAQAPLGAITVYYHLNPYLVLSHLLLSLLVLGIGVAVAHEAVVLTDGRAATPVPALARWGAVVLLVACAGLVVTGTVVTGSGPHPGGADVRRLGAFSTAIWLHVRSTAVFGIAFLGLLAWTWRARRRLPGAFRTAAVLLGLLVLQMALGEIQYRTGLPWWVVLMHVTVAASVWAAAVALAATLWRPPVSAVAPPA